MTQYRSVDELQEMFAAAPPGSKVRDDVIKSLFMLVDRVFNGDRREVIFGIICGEINRDGEVTRSSVLTNGGLDALKSFLVASIDAIADTKAAEELYTTECFQTRQ